MAEQTFNAQELLQRIRGAVPTGNSSTKGDFSKSTSISSPTSQHTSRPVVSPKVMSIPTVNFLTPTERREHLEIRAELDNEIQRLQQQTATLKSEKKQLQQENAALKQEVQSIKAKSEEKIANLRNQIAKLKFQLDEIQQANEKRVQVFNSMGIFGMAAKTGMHAGSSAGAHIGADTAGGTLSTKKSNRSQKHKLNDSEHSSSVNGSVVEGHGPNTVTLPNGYVQSLPFSFAEPTFSELMRRSTVEHDDFKTSLRKPANLGQPPIIQGPLDGGYEHKSYSYSSSHSTQPNYSSSNRDFLDDLEDIRLNPRDGGRLSGSDLRPYNSSREQEDEEDFQVLEIDLRN